jgi:hypothetical protein
MAAASKESAGRGRLGSFVVENSLSLFFLAIFVAALVGQAIAGHSLFNQEQLEHKEHAISLWRYMTSSHFGQAVTENWQSEYLQFALFALATVWLLQKGSPESKELDQAGLESDKEQKVGKHATEDSPRWARFGDLRTTLYSNSLIIVMALVFLASWFAQSVTGWSEFNDQQNEHGESAVSWLSYIGSSDFWEATFQNWQSEFLAVGSFAVLAVYLRQRGSPESKPVGAPTSDATGQEG